MATIKKTVAPLAPPATPELTDEIREVLTQIQPWIIAEATRFGNSFGYPERAQATLTHIFGEKFTADGRPTEAQLAVVKQYIVDKSLEYFRQMRWCSDATAGLTQLFGEPVGKKGERVRWRDSAGYDCGGFNVDGFNAEGVAVNGYRADGRYPRTDPDGVQRWYDRHRYDEDGFSETGYNREGVNRHGKRRDGTWLSDEHRATFLLKDLSPELKALLAAQLAAESETISEPVSA